MSKANDACNYAEAIARDDSHGYSQVHRWLNPDVDCSALAILSYQNGAGVPVKDNGATYTGNMYTVFCRTGFKDVTASVNIATGAGLKRGDVLLKDGHTALYCGNGLEVEAACDEYGGITGPNPGDQTGNEVLIQQYRPIWTCVLRYQEDEPDYLQKGDTGEDVAEMQRMLITFGYLCGPIGAAGRFTATTEKALKKFQRAYGLTVDGLYGKDSKKQLTSAYKAHFLEKWKATGTATCKNNDIYFRATPTSDIGKRNLLGKVGKGHRIEVDGTKSGGWVHARHLEYGVGYIYKSYVIYD